MYIFLSICIHYLVNEKGPKRLLELLPLAFNMTTQNLAEMLSGYAAELEEIGNLAQTVAQDYAGDVDLSTEVGPISGRSLQTTLSSHSPNETHTTRHGKRLRGDAMHL